jgi:tryptophan 2,3-dioxygenase
MHYFNYRKPMPQKALARDVTLPWTEDEEVQKVLIEIHRSDPEASMVGEALVDLDEGLQEWRYRHVKMVERTIGKKMGTGGSSGVGYLSSTLFHPVFPDLWAIRSQF